MSIEYLDRESYADKTKRFSGESAYRYDEKPARLQNVTPIDASEIQTDGSGNIEKMPALIGKPCFGIVTAYLRYGSPNQIRHPVTGKLFDSKCGGCKAREACVFVCNERIRALPEICRRLASWSKLGGRKIFGPNYKLKMKIGQSNWNRMSDVAAAAGFTNSNDLEVIRHWDGVQHVLRVEEDKAKTRQLRKSRAAGVLDDGLVALVMAERDKRAVYLQLEIMSPNPPHWITKLDNRSANTMASAWAARYLLGFQTREITPGMIATRMLKDKMVSGIGQPSLRQRLPNDLRRILWLETKRDGKRVWEKFDYNKPATS